MTAPPAKRARTTSQTPPITASKAIQDAITSLASSSADLSPDLYSQLLGSLSTAHTKALEQEREEASVKKEQGEKEQSPSASKEPVELKSWASTIQGDLKDVERRILEDIDAGMPKLDELGFLIRPLCVEGKIDLMNWTFAIPGRAGSEWHGCLFKGSLIFDSEYPLKPPRLRTEPRLFHPNTYPSGTLISACEPDNTSLDWPMEGERPICSLRLDDIEKAYSNFPTSLRLPLFFNGCRRLIHYPVLDDPAQLEAYALAKRDPIAYSARQKEEAKLHHPSLRDFLDLAEAQKRVKLRERQQE